MKAAPSITTNTAQTALHSKTLVALWKPMMVIYLFIKINQAKSKFLLKAEKAACI